MESRGEVALTDRQERDGPAVTAPAGSGLPAAAPAGSQSQDYAAVFRRSPVAMLLVDDAGLVVDANPAAERLLGHPPSGLPGTPLQALAPVAETEALVAGTSERRLRHHLGHDVWTLVSAVPLPELGERAMVVCLEDATTRRNTERLLLHAALHDSLTNLPNRRLLRDRLDTGLARAARSGSTVAVLFVDLDRFKDVNDTLGHDAGDEVLIHVAGGIHSALRSNDTVARLGGDEFVVVCEDVEDQHDIVHLAERLIANIEKPVHVHGHTVSVTASIGIALSPAGLGTGDDLLRRADMAMLRAKRRPDASFVLADDTTLDLTGYGKPEDSHLLNDLRHAIQADLLALHYQPVVRLDGRLVGLEALLRWSHPVHGQLLPQDFLPRVAGTEVARSLSDWVLRTAIRDAASWRDPRIRVSVNVWAEHVARPGFADTVAMLLTWAGLQARGLYLELHEHDLPDAGPGIAEELEQLHALGVGLALDDFGSGGTSLAGLRRLPIDALKVDRTFVAGLLRDPDDAALVATVAAVARAAGRYSLATGVETREQLRALEIMGYDSIQGYFSGAPAPLVDLREVIRARRVRLPAGATRQS